MGLLLGIDGGGTRTVAVAATVCGEVVAQAQGRSVNYYSVGLPAARENMATVMRDLQSGCGGKGFDCAFIGMSALHGPAARQELHAFTDGVIAAEMIGMDSDTSIALESMLEDGPCAMVVGGTGSMALLRDEQDVIHRAGGWGYILGDDGSAYRIALEGIRHGLRAADGAEEPTALTGAVRRFYGVDTLLDLTSLFYQPPMPREQIAAFAPEVYTSAREGDRTAADILKKQAVSLAEDALALIETHGPPDITVGINGGVFKNNGLFRQAFEAKIHNRFPDVCVRTPVYPPQIGALFCCKKLLRDKVNREFLANLDKTFQSLEEEDAR